MIPTTPPFSSQHGEEMKLISAALEAEGYGPSQVSADEVVRHLWWEKERMKKALGGNSTGEDDGEQDLEKLPQLFHVRGAGCACGGGVGRGARLRL